MIHSFLRSILCFCAAVLLLALMLCAVEVGCRGWDFMLAMKFRKVQLRSEEMTVPSAKSWIEVRPLIDFQLVNGEGATCRIRTNEFGLRGASVAIPKPDGVYRILCLGGTGVFGADVEEENTVTALLQRSLSQSAGNRVEIINAGCPQSGPLTQVLRYRASLAALNPDLIILCVSIDDLLHDVEVRGALKLDELRHPAYAAHPGALSTEFNIAVGIRREFLCLSWLMDWMGRSFSRGPLHPVLVPQEGGYGRREIGAIASLSALAETSHAKLIVSTVPSAWGVEQTRSALNHQRPTFADDIRKTLGELQVLDRVPVHDVLSNFCQIQDLQSAFSARRGCLTAGGNELYAQSLSQYLLENIPQLRPQRSNVTSGHSSSVVEPLRQITPVSGFSTR